MKLAYKALQSKIIALKIKAIILLGNNDNNNIFNKNKKIIKITRITIKIVTLMVILKAVKVEINHEYTYINKASDSRNKLRI